jgi:hypothetical protein
MRQADTEGGDDCGIKASVRPPSQAKTPAPGIGYCATLGLSQSSHRLGTALDLGNRVRTPSSPDLRIRIQTAWSYALQRSTIRCLANPAARLWPPRKWPQQRRSRCRLTERAAHAATGLHGSLQYKASRARCRRTAGPPVPCTLQLARAVCTIFERTYNQTLSGSVAGEAEIIVHVPSGIFFPSRRLPCRSQPSR